jgi:hypothetical protein
MAASPAGPVLSFATARAKSRAIPDSSGIGTRRPGGIGVTAIRPRRVGRPSSRSMTPAPDALVGEAVATALESLTLIERRAQEVARDFRWNRSGNAREGLGDVVHGVAAVVALAAAAAGAQGGDVENTDDETATEATRTAIGELIRHQHTGDWPALADALEYDFIPALRQWRRAIETIETIDGPSDDPTPGGCAA